MIFFRVILKFIFIAFFSFPAFSSNDILELSTSRNKRTLSIDFQNRVIEYVVYKNVTNTKNVKRTIDFYKKGLCDLFQINLKVEVNPDLSRAYWRIWPHFERLDAKFFNGIEKSDRFILTFQANDLFDSLINKNLINIEEAYNKGSDSNRVFLGFMYSCKDISMLNKAGWGTRFRLFKKDREKLLKYSEKASIRYTQIAKAKKETDEKARKLAEEKERKLAEEKERKLAEEKERKAIEEKERKLAEEKARKKRIAEEKARKKKEAAEKARKKKLAEQERKRKLEQDKIVKKVKDYKRQAVNFYKDIEEFVKSGGKIDLVELSKLFNIKPDPKKNWNSSDFKTYENLRQFMSSVSEFVSYEKQMIGERLKKSFALKDQSIAQLEKNLDDLKGLMRKMFGSSDTPKITKMISDIESSLANFNQSKANKLIVRTTNYISSKLDKPKIVEKSKKNKVIKKVSIDQSWSEFKSKMSIQQGQFCQLTDSFFDNLNNARKSKNEIKVNIVHRERQGDLDALIPGGKISNWIFKVMKIDQVEDGSAAVVLSLQCKSYVGSGQIHTKSTWKSKSNKEWRATIPYNDRRFRELAKLNSGEFVVASGVMLEIGAYKPGQKETFYASQQIGEHPLTKDLNLEGELFIADLSYIAALN